MDAFYAIYRHRVGDVVLARTGECTLHAVHLGCACVVHGSRGACV